MARIVVGITADAGQAIAETGQFTKSLGELQLQLARMEKLQPFQNSIESFNRAQKAIDATKGRIEVLNQALSGGSKSFTSGSNQAAFALQNLGRVAQDAPFGFIGIQNNLNPLLESFQRLKAESGSSGAALKALGSSLLGPAGLGIALSVVTSAILLYTQWTQKSAKATEDATEANDKYLKSLGGVTMLLGASIKEQSKEINELDLLYRATQNVTLSDNERKKAILGLREVSGAHLKTYTDEQILAGRAAIAVENLKKEYLALGVIRAASTELDKQAEAIYINTVKSATAQARLNPLLKEYAELKKQVDALPVSQSEFGNVSPLIDKFQALGIQIRNIQGEIKGYSTATGEAERQSENLKNVQDGLLKQYGYQVNKNVAKGLDEQAKATKKAADEADKLREALAKMPAFGLDKTTLDPSNFAKNNPLDKLFPSPIEIENHLSGKTAQAVLKGSQAIINNMQLATDSMMKVLEDFNNRAADIINNGITSTFDGLGEAIGNSLAGAGNILQNVTQTLFSVLGDIVMQLGKLAIATAVGIKGIKTALATLNPVVALTAGVALVALGKAIKTSITSLADVPGYASGTNFAPGGVALVGERGPELVNLPRGSQVIPNHAISAQGAFGGGFIAETRVDLESLWIGLKRTDRNRGLLG